MKKIRGWYAVLIAVLFVALQACSGGGGSGSSLFLPTGAGVGTVSVSVTDAPAYGYDHVWITVKDIWFNASTDAGPMQSGWYKFPLASPVTLDLLELSNGAISVPILDGAELPEGTYQQVRVLLAATEDALTASATAAGLKYNNEVDVTGDAAQYPLRVPDARGGIRLDGTFDVMKNGKLKIAVDFDAGHDVVKMEHDGTTEYILKPRLVSFDLDNAGAITGHIDSTAAGERFAARFVVKAEQLGPGGFIHVVRRATFVADGTGAFVLYPLLPGNYDVLIRGIGYETTIIKNVPVTKGTTPTSGATVIPSVTLTKSPDPDYPASARITSPTGAWVDYFQTLAAGEAPYEVRFSHFHPLTGQFANFPLSSGPLQVGTYDPTSITLNETVPVEGNGGFKAVAVAILYQPSSFVSVTSASLFPTDFGTLSVKAPATARSISGTITIPADKLNTMDRGVVFAVHGGMIVNAMNADSKMGPGGQYTLGNIPGGSSTQPLPMAFYGITAFGWSSTDPTVHAVAVPVMADLSAADATGIDLSMLMLP